MTSGEFKPMSSEPSRYFHRSDAVEEAAGTKTGRDERPNKKLVETDFY